MKYDLKKVQCTKGQEISEENSHNKKHEIFPLISALASKK